MADDGRPLRTAGVVVFVLLSLVFVILACAGLTTIGGLTVLGSSLDATFDAIENSVD